MARSLGTLTVDLIARVSGFAQGLTEAERRARRSNDRIAEQQRQMAARVDAAFGAIKTGAVVAYAAVSAAMVAAVAKGIEAGDKLDEMSARLSISVERLSGLSYVGEMSGVGFEELTNALPKLSKAMAESQEQGSKFDLIFKALGITAVDSSGKLKDASVFLLEISDAFKAYDDATGEAALAMEIFGKSGAGFLEFLNRGSEEINQMIEYAQRMGLVMSTDSAAAAAELKDKLAELDMQTTVLGAVIAEKLLPKLIEAIEGFQNWSKDGKTLTTITDFLSGAIDTASVAFNGISLALTQANLAISSAITIVTSYIEILKTAITTIYNFQSSILSLDFSGAFDSLQNGLMKIGDTSKDAFSQLADNAKNSFASAAKNANEAWHTVRGTMTDEEFAADKARRAAEKAKQAIKSAGSSSSQQNNGWGIANPGWGEQVNKNASSVANLSEEEQRLQRIRDKANKNGGLVPRSIFTGEDKTDKAGKSGGGGASKEKKEVDEAAKAVERLNEQYKALIESYNEKIFLMGEDSDLAKMTYDVQLGSLKGLTEEQKEHLLLLSKTTDEKKKAMELANEEEEKRKSEIENAKDINKELEFQLTLVGKTADEQERLNLLRSLGGQADTDLGKKAVENLKVLQDASKSMAQQVEIADNIRTSVSDGLQDWIKGTKSFGDAFSDVLDNIYAKILQTFTDNLIQQLMGSFGTSMGGSVGGAGGGNWFASLFGGMRASGGSVGANKYYRVNENGPEMLSVSGKDYLMMGASSGHITPNHRLGMGSSQVNNFTIQGRIDRRTEQQIAYDVGRKAQAAQGRNG